MSDAREFCNAAAAKKKGIKLPEINPVAAIIKAFRPENKGKADNRSLASNKSLARAVSKMDSRCSGGASVKQVNSIDTTKCSVAMRCGDPAQVKGMNPAQMRRWLDYKTKLCTLSGVKQTNSARARVDCRTSQLVSQLASQKMTAESLATLERVMQASGMMSRNSAVTDNCSAVSNDLTVEQLASSYQACVQNLSFDQKNALESCGASLTQVNSGDALARCVLNAASSSETGQEAEGKSSSETNEKYKAEVVTMGMISSSICLSLVAMSAMYLFWSERGGGQRR